MPARTRSPVHRAATRTPQSGSARSSSASAPGPATTTARTLSPSAWNTPTTRTRPTPDRYTRKGWLRCETTAILGVWNPAYRMLTHAAAGLDLPDDVGMAPALYGVHVEARRKDNRGHVLLRLGPYNQARHTDRDVDRLSAHLEGKEDEIMPGFTLTVKGAVFDVSDHLAYCDPYEADTIALLAAAVRREGAPHLASNTGRD